MVNIHECIQVSLFLGTRKKGNLGGCFHSFLQERNGQIRSGKLLRLIGYIGNETRQFSISLPVYSGGSIFSNASFFIESRRRLRVDRLNLQK